MGSCMPCEDEDDTQPPALPPFAEKIGDVVAGVATAPLMLADACDGARPFICSWEMADCEGGTLAEASASGAEAMCASRRETSMEQELRPRASTDLMNLMDHRVVADDVASDSAVRIG